MVAKEGLGEVREGGWKVGGKERGEVGGKGGNR